MAKTTLHQDVDQVRDEIEPVREELQWLASSSVPRDELKARITAAVGVERRNADSGRVLRSLASPTSDAYSATFADMFKVQTKATFLGGDKPDILPAEVPLSPMLAWLLGDELTKNLHAKVDALEYTPGPPMAERPARRAQLLATLRQLEEKEEALICTGEAAGLWIARRGDADPAVVLGYDPKGSMTEAGGVPGITVAPRGVLNAVPDQVATVQSSAPAAAPSVAQASMPSMGPVAMQARTAARGAFKTAFLP